jgi:hypothetical protein
MATWIRQAERDEVGVPVVEHRHVRSGTGDAASARAVRAGCSRSAAGRERARRGGAALLPRRVGRPVRDYRMRQR